MLIVYNFKDILEEQKYFENDVLIGRHDSGINVDVDLKIDHLVSHKHACVSVREGQCWIKDLGSRNGTFVNGDRLMENESRAIQEEDVIQIGTTKLRIKMREELPKNEEHSNITLTLDAKKPVFSLTESMRSDAERRLAIFYELPLQFGGEIELDSLLQKIVSKLIDIVPGGVRAAIAIKDSVTERLLLKAHVPPGNPYLSMTLANRALDEKVGFIWQRESDPDVTQADNSADCALYAPLLWKGQALGVLVLDSFKTTNVFAADDLRLLMAVAEHAAMAVANQLLQEDLRRETLTKSNLLRHFSPKIAERILNHRGRLQIGGERCEATILFADIRGFSQVSRNMEPETVVELLNYYFAGLLPIIFAHDGSVEKYIGDAILSVFGSPEPDPIQYEKAVRAAMEMQKKMVELNSAREMAGEIACNIGIGIHCGEIVHGFVGIPDRMAFAVIGDAVNRAARYCDGAKAGEILISPALYERVWRIVRDSEPITFDAKFQEHFSGYRITGLWE